MSAPAQERATEEVIAGLRRWTESHDDHVRAAAELLIERGWPRRRDFLRAAVENLDGVAVIRWRAAAAFAETCIASTTELAILTAAIDLATDRWRLTSMGPANRTAIVRAVTAAVGRAGAD